MIITILNQGTGARFASLCCTYNSPLQLIWIWTEDKNQSHELDTFMVTAINKIIKMMSDLSKLVDMCSGSAGRASGRATTFCLNP